MNKKQIHSWQLIISLELPKGSVVIHISYQWKKITTHSNIRDVQLIFYSHRISIRINFEHFSRMTSSESAN